MIKLDTNRMLGRLVATALVLFTIYSLGRWVQEGAVLEWFLTLLTTAGALVVSGALRRVGSGSSRGRFAEFGEIVSTIPFLRRLRGDATARWVAAAGFGFVVATVEALVAPVFAGIENDFLRGALPLALVGGAAWTVVGLVTTPAIAGGLVSQLTAALGRAFGVDKAIRSVLTRCNLDIVEGPRLARVAVAAATRTASTVIVRWFAVAAVTAVVASTWGSIAVGAIALTAIGVGPELLVLLRRMGAEVAHETERAGTVPQDVAGTVHVDVDDATKTSGAGRVVPGTGTPTTTEGATK